MKPEERKDLLNTEVGIRDEGAILEKTGVRLAKYLTEFRRRVEQDTSDPKTYLQSISYIADKIHHCADLLLTEQDYRMEGRSRWRRHA